MHLPSVLVRLAQRRRLTFRPALFCLFLARAVEGEVNNRSGSLHCLGSGSQWEPGQRRIHRPYNHRALLVLRWVHCTSAGVSENLHCEGALMLREDCPSLTWTQGIRK